MTIIKTYIITLIIFFAVDILWLGFVAKHLYRQEIGFIMSDRPNWPAAILFYLIFIGGMVFFVIHPALAKESWRYALGVGLVFGFITYATYDLTNLATLKDWPIRITIIDMAWGTCLGGVVSVLSYSINSLLR